MDQYKLNMTYIMHVNWFWIKQRPHFIAEELKNDFNLTVFTPNNYRNNNQLVKEDMVDFVKVFMKLPLQRFNRFKLFQLLDFRYIAAQLKKNIRNSRYIWFTSPIYYKALKKYISPDQILIYDCMDDFIEFPLIKSNKKLLDEYKAQEAELIKRANHVTFSSEHLRNIVSERYKLDKPSHIVNNAISEKLLKDNSEYQSSAYPPKNGFVDLLYIGTISHWFNFDLIMESLYKNSKIRYVLIGPKEIEIPSYDRIVYLGPKKHEELNAYMCGCDALIMPFIVNDLIKSVNPVKLYEYIYSGKPIITCSYTEINQFKDFVYQYKSDADFFQLTENLVNKNLVQKNLDSCKNFARNNTWNSRYKSILKIIAS